MKPPSTSLAIWTAVLLLLGPVASLPVPDSLSLLKRGLDFWKSSTSQPQDSLFRGEYGRTPQQVAASGGLMSKGFTRNFEHPLTPQERGWASSLTEHISGRNKPVSMFVSTTSDPALALRFAAGGQTPKFYVYEVAPDKKAINVEKSIKKFEKSYAATQKEWAFAKGIPNQQIKGHYALDATDYTPNMSLGPAEFKQQFAHRFVPNPQFDKTFSLGSFSGKQRKFDKLYTGQTGVSSQNDFAAAFAATLPGREKQDQASAIKDLDRFFKKASPKQGLLESSRPNWSTIRPFFQSSRNISPGGFASSSSGGVPATRRFKDWLRGGRSRQA
ncbi:putative enterotoxin [Ophiocordyceps australis]|uniref:Putative enterotoxin n=1 Tax=Ophiocordyceps australis TaxID=1399860 RepID=A0A2C5Y7C2_9HYPO|nr:putative enterotoxin [Ophiocordyceps australis]